MQDALRYAGLGPDAEDRDPIQPGGELLGVQPVIDRLDLEPGLPEGVGAVGMDALEQERATSVRRRPGHARILGAGRRGLWWRPVARSRNGHAQPAPGPTVVSSAVPVGQYQPARPVAAIARHDAQAWHGDPYRRAM